MIQAPAQSKAPAAAYSRKEAGLRRTTPARPAASGFTPGKNLATMRYLARCAANRSLACRMSESGSRENRQRISNTRGPRGRPSEYQSMSAPRVAIIAARMETARSMWPEPDRAPTPSSVGTAGAGSPACTANAHANTTATPYSPSRSGTGATESRRESGSDRPCPLHIRVRLQRCPTETTNRMQDHLHVSLGVQHEYRGRTRLHQHLPLRDELNQPRSNVRRLESSGQRSKPADSRRGRARDTARAPPRRARALRQRRPARRSTARRRPVHH